MKGKKKKYSSPIYITITVIAALLPAVCLLPASLSAQTLELNYSTYLGGSGWDEGGGIELGTDGSVYLTGETSSSDFPTRNPYQAATGANSDVFISRLGSSGSSLIYSTYLGGSSSDEGHAITLDTAGAVYLTGYTYSPNFPTRNPYQAGTGGNSDVFVSCLDSSGSSLIYSTYLGGSEYDEGDAIDLGPAGAVSLTGNVDSSDFPTENPYQSTFTGSDTDVFVSRLDSSGSSLIYSTYLGGDGYDYGYAITVGTAGAAFISGNTGSSDFPTENPYQAGSGGSADAFVSRLDSSGSGLLFSSYLGGSSWDDSWGIALGTAGAAYLTGYTYSPDFPTENPYQAGIAGSSDVFVSKLTFNPSASLVFSSYLGGANNEFGEDITLGTGGDSYLTGYTESSDFPTENPYQSALAGDYDVFASRLTLNPSAALVFSTYLGGSSRDEGHGVVTGPNEREIYLAGRTQSTDFPTENPYQAGFGGTYDAFVSRLILITPTPTSTPTPSVTPTASVTPTPSATPTQTPSVTPTPSMTPTPSVMPTAADTPTPATTATPLPTASPTPWPTPEYLVIADGDYNGDGTADIAVFRQESGLWAVRGLGRIYFGELFDIPASGDYDGDGIADVAVFRPSTGLWAVKDLTRIYLGISGDIPAPGDYDGDGFCDPAVFRDSSGLWSVRDVTRLYFGTSGDRPVPGDYDDDGTVDPAVFRDATGLWAVRDLTRVYFGSTGDRPIPAVYRWYPVSRTAGPYQSQIAVYRSTAGLWAIRRETRFYYGGSADHPVPAVFAGGPLAAPAVFRGSTGLWAIRGLTRIYFGRDGDSPVSR